jgi:hypothetical protein
MAQQVLSSHLFNDGLLDQRFFGVISIETDDFSITITINGKRCVSFLNLFFRHLFSHDHFMFNFYQNYRSQIPDKILFFNILLVNVLKSIIRFPRTGDMNVIEFMEDGSPHNSLKRSKQGKHSNNIFPVSIDGLCSGQEIIVSPISFKSEDGKIVYLQCKLLIPDRPDILFIVEVYIDNIAEVLELFLPTYTDFKGNIEIGDNDDMKVDYIDNQSLLCFEDPNSPGSTLCIYSLNIPNRRHTEILSETIVIKVPSILTPEDIALLGIALPQVGSAVLENALPQVGGAFSEEEIIDSLEKKRKIDT